MRSLFFTALLLFVAGCTPMHIEDVRQTEPKLNIEEYFDGKVYAWGLFEDRFGVIKRQFLVEIDGTWDGETLRLEEEFLYNDGERDHRTWIIESTQPNTYSGTAADVAGTAAGISAGNTLNWRYELDLKVGDGTWRVKFDDWMVLQQGGVMLNRAYIKKWGVTLGTVTLSFMRGDDLKAVPFSLESTSTSDLK